MIYPRITLFSHGVYTPWCISSMRALCCRKLCSGRIWMSSLRADTGGSYLSGNKIWVGGREHGYRHVKLRPHQSRTNLLRGLLCTIIWRPYVPQPFVSNSESVKFQLSSAGCYWQEECSLNTLSHSERLSPLLLECICD